MAAVLPLTGPHGLLTVLAGLIVGPIVLIAGGPSGSGVVASCLGVAVFAVVVSLAALWKYRLSATIQATTRS